MALEVPALVIAGLVLLSMPVFRLAGGRRPRDPDMARRSRSVLLGQWLRDWLVWIVGPVERAAVRAGWAPEVFNYLGLLFGAGAGLSFAVEVPSVAALFLLLAGVADVLDGRIARARGTASSYGAFLDSTLDRFVELFVFLGLAWAFSRHPWGVILVVAALGGSLLVSYARARGQAVGVDCDTGILQRAERFVLLALAGLLDRRVAAEVGWPPNALLAGALAVIAVGSLSTAVYRTVVIARALK